MLIQATNEQVQEMAALAVNASIPMGMGFLHYIPDNVFTFNDFANNISSRGMFLDYVQGRMVKFCMWKAPEHPLAGVWRCGTPQIDYESWLAKYKGGYKELAEMVGAYVLDEAESE